MPSRGQWVTVLILWVSHTIYFLNYMTVGTLAPFIQMELKLTTAQVGFLGSAVTIGAMAIQIPAGILCDLFGTKWVMASGFLLIGGAAVSMSWIDGYAGVFVLLILLGLGIGCNQAPASKAIVMWFPSRGRATAMGIKQTGINMGGVLASIVLPALAVRFGDWRGSFEAAGLGSLLMAVGLVLFFKDQPHRYDGSFQDLFARDGKVRGLVGDRDFLLICLSGILLMVAQYSFATYLFLYATRALGFPIHRTGALLALAFAMGALARIGWGVMSDRCLGERRRPAIMMIGIGCAVVSSVFALMGNSRPEWLVLVSIVVFGLTGLGWNAIYLTMVAEFPEKELAGIAAGINFIFANLGAIAGPPLFGYLVDLTGEYTFSWFFIALCTLTVAVLSKVQKREKMVV